MESFNLKNLVMQFKHIENSESEFHPNGIKGMKKSDFIKMNQNVSESIFNGIDFDSDGVISDGEYNLALGIAGEDGVLTKEERNNACMQQMTFFARRGIDKWFSIDKNRDGYGSELEMRAWQEANCNNQGKVMYLDNVGLEKYYESKDFIHENAQNIEQWLESEIEDLKKKCNMYVWC